MTGGERMTGEQKAMPFGHGSVSLGLYLHDLPPTRALDELFAQAGLALEAGFDGITLPEHHDGFASYVPAPLQVTGWLLQEFPRGWAAANPLIIPLRPVQLWIEELAWLAARFPGRVGLGTAPGYVEDDFAAVGASFAGRFQRNWTGVELLVQALRGRPPAGLARDPAVAALREASLPMVAAAVGKQSIAHAARLGLGIAPPGEDGECVRIFGEYCAAGGDGPRLVNRWPWLGPPPAEPAVAPRPGGWETLTDSRQRRADRSWLKDNPRRILSAARPELLAERLNASIAYCGATGLGIRLHRGKATPPAMVTEMIESLGQVLPLLRFPAPISRSAPAQEAAHG
jgi:alkanesulfonate monooxygenase SsuD/methylene tetrahydromethanopterin reductase-like flavin-dependent oxidoreductase (luciferase family)